MFVEVESNPNCENSVFLRFKEVAPAQPVSHVKIYERTSRGEWCAVTGWCDDPEQAVCSAYAQKVEDSGAGVTLLVFGGNYGVRLKPENCQDDWELDHPEQWGEAYLSLSDERDIRYEQSYGCIKDSP
jgi:hypothetical protein